jgi:hypothetical protein
MKKMMIRWLVIVVGAVLLGLALIGAYYFWQGGGEVAPLRPEINPLLGTWRWVDNGMAYTLNFKDDTNCYVTVENFPDVIHNTYVYSLGRMDLSETNKAGETELVLSGAIVPSEDGQSLDIEVIYNKYDTAKQPVHLERLNPAQ